MALGREGYYQSAAQQESSLHSLFFHHPISIGQTQWKFKGKGAQMIQSIEASFLSHRVRLEKARDCHTE